MGTQHSTSCLAASTSSTRPTGVMCGASWSRSGFSCASRAIALSALAKASSVSLLSVSVGSIISASGTISGK